MIRRPGEVEIDVAVATDDVGGVEVHAIERAVIGIDGHADNRRGASY